jgi:hypothetical protein
MEIKQNVDLLIGGFAGITVQEAEGFEHDFDLW